MSTPSGAYAAALELIRRRSDFEHGSIANQRSEPRTPSLGLTRTRALLDALGAPDRAYPIVHVAGSKGKGSTSAFVAAIGKSAGYRTGLTTSPHLHSLRERIAIDGEPINEATFAALAFEVATAIERLEHDRPDLGSVTAFELLAVMALLAFAEQNCNLAVVEVGLGGTYDATNVITPAVSIITRLDFEHTQILGDTIESIAANKAGIIKPGVPVVTVAQDPGAMAVIRSTAQENAAPLFVAGRDFDAIGGWQDFSWSNSTWEFDHLCTGMAGPHQMENASLAIAACMCLATQGFAIAPDALRRGVASAALAGRFERVEADGRIWILDGAHTPVAAAALSVEVLSEIGGPVLTIAGLLNDKHPAQFFEALAPCVSELILTEPRNPRAIPTAELIPIARSANSQVTASRDLHTSMQRAQQRSNATSPVLITGSLTLVAEARERLGLAVADSTMPVQQTSVNLRLIAIG